MHNTKIRILEGRLAEDGRRRGKSVLLHITISNINLKLLNFFTVSTIQLLFVVVCDYTFHIKGH